MGSLAGLQGKAVMHAASKKAEGLLEPLIVADEENNNERSPDSTAGDVSEKVKQTPAQKLKMVLVSVGVGVGVAVSAAAMILNPVTAVFVMGAIAVVNAPYAVFKEHKIKKLPELRGLTNKLKESANNLEDEVDDLKEAIDDLKPEAARAASLEAQLKEIADKQQINVDRFVALVKENEMINAQARDNLRKRIVQDVLHIVLFSDKNNDGQFSEVETKMLVLKISLQLQEYGVEFDEVKFRKVMGPDPSVPKAIEIIKRLIPDLNEGGDDPEEEEEDEETRELYDMFHMVDTSEDAFEGSPVGSFSGPTTGEVLAAEAFAAEALAAEPVVAGPAVSPVVGGPVDGEPYVPAAGGPTVGGPTVGGPTVGGPTVGEPTTLMTAPSAAGGAQTLSLSARHESPRRKRRSLSAANELHRGNKVSLRRTIRKRDKLKQKLRESKHLHRGI